MAIILTSPRSPPTTRRLMLVEIVGNGPHSVQLPFEPPPEPPFPPLDPPGGAWRGWIPTGVLVGVVGQLIYEADQTIQLGHVKVSPRTRQRNSCVVFRDQR